jgi:hypothetical protein
MAQTNFTPISLYYSATSSNVPTDGNLVAGELAINTADGKLFYKDSSGVVQTIASKAGNVNVASFSGGTTGLTPNTATTGIVTLAGTLASANGGTGQTNITFPSTGGTAMVSGNMPAFSAYKSASQTLAYNSVTKITFDTEEFDTNNNFASSRFTPTVAGYYEINSTIYFAGTASYNYYMANDIYKNGVAYKRNVISLYQLGSAGEASLVTSNIIYMNGSTDYLEVYGYQVDYTTAGSMTIIGGISYTTFNGSLVRAA